MRARSYPPCPSPSDPWAARPAIVRRRLRAARLARLLRPPAAALGGFTSIELAVALPEGLRRPDVGVVLGDPPVDGILDRAPILVIELGPDVQAARWLAAGAAAVWLIGACQAMVCTAAAPARPVPPPGVLTVPGWPGLCLPAEAALAVDHAGAQGGARGAAPTPATGKGRRPVR